MKTILIVDPEFSPAGAEVLNRHGFVTFVVSEGRTALTIVGSGMPVDLVISEIQLPDMTGLDFLNNLKRVSPGLPVLVVTAQGTIESYLRAVNLGVIEYLNKPVLAKELSHIIRIALDQGRRTDALFDAA